MDLVRQLGENVRRIRKLREISQEALALDAVRSGELEQPILAAVAQFKAQFSK